MLIISKPLGEAKGDHPPISFGYRETQGQRLTQEDTLIRSELPMEPLRILTPLEIAYRLWTTYQAIDIEISTHDLGHVGSTAISTVYNGDNHLITASLGDSVAFIAIYDCYQECIHVTRLNTELHNTSNHEELKRIMINDGSLTWAAGALRVGGLLTPTRSIGNHDLKPWVTAEALIDIVDIKELCKANNISEYSTIKIITTCDGFTEPFNTDKKKSQEQIMLQFLKRPNTPCSNEFKLANSLVKYALKKGSKDNISVSVQTIFPGIPLILGLFDGHGGTEVSHAIADWIYQIFYSSLFLNQENYQDHPFSVWNCKQAYLRDNKSYWERSNFRMQEEEKEELLSSAIPERQQPLQAIEPLLITVEPKPSSLEEEPIFYEDLFKAFSRKKPQPYELLPFPEEHIEAEEYDVALQSTPS